MKKVFLIFSIISCVMTTFAQSSFYVYKTDGSSTEYLVNEVDSISFVAPTTTEIVYDYVDLGLSVKWATCNVGATKPEEYGNYYAWGETTTKSEYTPENYTYAENSEVLPLDRDAAAVNMGGDWRMPTSEEQQELIDECTWTWTTLNDVRGYNVEGPNGNSIFLPAAGSRLDSDLTYAGSICYYWSSSLGTGSSSGAYGLYVYSGSVHWGITLVRSCGLSVRGVCP